MPPPTVRGMKHWSARIALDDVHHGAATVCGGGDVEENHFVRALLVVAEGEFHGVADVAQAALLGDAELDAASDLTIMDVSRGQGNDTFCNHVNIKGGVVSKGKWY